MSPASTTFAISAAAKVDAAGGRAEATPAATSVTRTATGDSEAMHGCRIGARRESSQSFRRGEIRRGLRRRPGYSGRMRSLAVAVLALLADGCGRRLREREDGRGRRLHATTTESEATPARSTREAAPPLAGDHASTATQSRLGDFRGRPVLINVWSSW